MLKKTLYISISFIFIISILACENNIAVKNAITAESEKKLPLETSKNVDFYYSDSAIVRAHLSAVQVDRYGGKKPYLEIPKGLKIVFYQKDKKEQTILTANYGIGYDSGNGNMEKMEAKGNVIVINEKGDKLNTEHLIWDIIAQKIYTDKFVKITTKEQIIWGDGMEANQDFSEYQIKNVKGEIEVENADLAPSNGDNRIEEK